MGSQSMNGGSNPPSDTKSKIIADIQELENLLREEARYQAEISDTNPYFFEDVFGPHFSRIYEQLNKLE